MKMAENNTRMTNANQEEHARPGRSRYLHGSPPMLRPR
jgi:hypothetical protein